MKAAPIYLVLPFAKEIGSTLSRCRYGMHAGPLGPLLVVLAVLAVGGVHAADPSGPYEPAALYPPETALTASPGDTTYWVDPARGNDANPGRSATQAWKSLARVNALRLGAGDQVMIASGLHQETLKPGGHGTAGKPIRIRFLRGVHEFGVGQALRRPWYISNSCDSPTPKPMGILVENASHVRFEGEGLEGDRKTLILMGGRMIYFVNHQAEDITYSGLAFDLKRPTVSEYRVVAAGSNQVVIRVAEGSTFEIENGRFAWTGDVGSGWVMAQQAIPDTGKCWRMGQWDPFANAIAEDLGTGTVKLSYTNGTLGMLPGRQFQFRHTFRDSAGGHNSRSQEIVVRDCDFYALANMGIVSQFTENITFERVRFAPPPATFRTCPCWADAIHFSGCKGEVRVEGCLFSGLQDDPINVHGTHLRIMAQTGTNQLHVRFMQPQTYGFRAFTPGDELAVIDHTNLRELPDNPRRKVLALEPASGDRDGKNWLLTLDGPVPRFGKDDVVDNVTWYPNFTARSNLVTMDSCRGFLITTRGKAVVEGNTFNRCAMPGVLVEDDAEGWFESGPIQDLLLRGNRFVGCGIEINPQTHSNKPEEPVHHQIRIEENTFEESGISARSTEGLTVVHNHFSTSPAPIQTRACTKVVISENAP